MRTTNPRRLGGRTVDLHKGKTREHAFAMVELIVVIATALLLLILFTVYVRQGTAKRHRIACVNNLKQIGLAFRVSLTDTSGRAPSAEDKDHLKELSEGNPAEIPAIVWALTNQISDPRILTCPADKRHAPATDWSGFNRGNISYFFNLDDHTATKPQLLLSGDSDLRTNGVAVSSGMVTLVPGVAIGWTKDGHYNAGNVVLGDGSVQQMTSQRLQEVLTGSAPMKLWVP